MRKEFYKEKENYLLTVLLTISWLIFFISSILSLLGMMLLFGILSWVLLLTYLFNKKIPNYVFIEDHTIGIGNNKTKFEKKINMLHISYYEKKGVLTLQEAKSKKYLISFKKSKWTPGLFLLLKKNIEQGKEKKRVDFALLQAILPS